MLLPAPLVPITPRISPDSTVSVTPSKARTSPGPEPKTFVSSSTSIMGVLPFGLVARGESASP